MDHVTENRAYWDGQADWYAARAREHWAAEDVTWGIWNLPQAQVPLLPDDVAGLDVIELGCGTGYVSSWLARRGARPVGLDNSPRQLATARRMQAEFGIRFPLVHADAERLPFACARFDLAISEYGAAVWCDPYRWVPEAARVLRPGGRLAFLRNATLLMLCMPEETAAGERLLRPQFGLHRLTWPEGGAEFALGHAEWFALLRRSGFTVDALYEPRPPQAARTDYDFVTAEWARRWPSEEAWIATRSG